MQNETSATAEKTSERRRKGKGTAAAKGKGKGKGKGLDPAAAVPSPPYFGARGAPRPIKVQPLSGLDDEGLTVGRVGEHTRLQLLRLMALAGYQHLSIVVRVF
eukprot:SAG31_NODE_9762_length_1230_cov_10.711760_2_plen_103_part_00